MANIEKHIDVNVPVRTAYDQWTQFEEFPKFMERIDRIEQVDDTHLHWVADIGGRKQEWDARIDEQTPDQRIAWTSITGDKNAGVVTFHKLTDSTTRVMLQLDYEPAGIVEKTGDMLGFVSRRVEGDLGRFKTFIEARGEATGGWRGDVGTT